MDNSFGHSVDLKGLGFALDRGAFAILSRVSFEKSQIPQLVLYLTSFQDAAWGGKAEVCSEPDHGEDRGGCSWTLPRSRDSVYSACVPHLATATQ